MKVAEKVGEKVVPSVVYLVAKRAEQKVRESAD